MDSELLKAFETWNPRPTPRTYLVLRFRDKTKLLMCTMVMLALRFGPHSDTILVTHHNVELLSPQHQTGNFCDASWPLSSAQIHHWDDWLLQCSSANVMHWWESKVSICDGMDKPVSVSLGQNHVDVLSENSALHKQVNNPQNCCWQCALDWSGSPTLFHFAL